MKNHTVTLASAIFVSAASIAYAASTTVNINAIGSRPLQRKSIVRSLLKRDILPCIASA
jgi:hypothetical protein